jgi:hypothetical protein
MARGKDSQVSFNVTSSRFDICGRSRAIWADDYLVADIVRKHVVVLGEGIDTRNVKVQKIGRPSGTKTVNGAIDG